jgi:hypothetical protein
VNGLVRFTTMVMFVGFILLFGVIIGINTAEEGIRHIEGVPPNSGQRAFSIQSQNGQVGIDVLGKTYQHELPDAKTWQALKEKQKDHISFLSRIANEMGQMIRNGTKNGLEWLLQVGN